MNHHQTPLIAALLQSAKSNGRPSLLGYASDPSKSWVTPGRCTAAKNHGCNSQNPNGMIHHNPSWIEPVQRWAWQLGRQNWGRTPPGRVQGVLVQIEPLVVGQSSFRMLPWQPAGLVLSLQGLSDCSYLQLPNNAEKLTGFLWTKQSCNTINNSQRATSKWSHWAARRPEFANFPSSWLATFNHAYHGIPTYLLSPTQQRLWHPHDWRMLPVEPSWHQAASASHAPQAEAGSLGKDSDIFRLLPYFNRSWAKLNKEKDSVGQWIWSLPKQAGPPDVQQQVI